MESKSAPVIRHFEDGDRALVEEFFANLGPETRAFFNRSGNNTRFALKFFENDPQDRSTTCRYMAEYEGKMVGYSFAWELDTGIPWFGIALADGSKGLGLGEKLTNIVVEHCRKLGKGGVILTTHTANIRAQVLYEKCGFERMGIYDGPQDRGEILYLYRFGGKISPTNWTGKREK